jgi:hypothetical protein
MMSNSKWSHLWTPGQGILLREIWHDRVYSVVPVRVVQDSPHLTALYLPPGTRSLWPHTRAGETIRIPADDWVLDGGPWEGGDLLYLFQPGVGYTATAVWDREHVFDHWKIDLVEAPRRTRLGFDYMDQLLDILVSADRSTWRWKDDDEVVEAQARGIFGAEQAHELYRRGEEALKALLTNAPPFDSDWQSWKPEPALQIPFDLPADWNWR